MWTCRAQPQWAIEEFGDAWTLPGNFQTYGNFVLAEYTPGDVARIVKNPFWPGTPSHPVPVLDEMEFNFLEASAALAAYEAGELDFIDEVPLPDMPRVKVERPEELYIGPGDCTYYYGFNVTKAPVDNVHLRRALSLALDRNAIVTITAGGQQPAGFFSRPNFAASPTQEEYPYPEFGVATDPERAKEELQAYFDETGTTLEDLPPITLAYNTSEAHALIAQAVQQQWNETLGIDVQVTNQEWQVYLDTLDEDPPQVWRLGWCKDYLDPNNFLKDVFYSTSGNNHTEWANAEFDAIVDEAAVLDDTQARKDLYSRAEQILTWEDAAMIPIYFYTNVSMGQTYLNRTFSTTGVERFDKWDLP
jgi:oligopeptide transport system substrate-binding protein